MYNNKLQLYCSSDNNMRLRFGSSINRLLQWHNYWLFILTMSMTPPVERRWDARKDSRGGARQPPIPSQKLKGWDRRISMF
jgi:hypothetical protein